MAIKATGQNLVGLMIFTLITIMAWIGFDVYRTLNKKSLPTINEEEVKPFNPVLDTNMTEMLKKRFSPSEEELGKIPETNKIKLEATPSASPKTKLP